jgi:hypothetical protein
MDLNIKVVISPEVLSQEVTGETVLLDLNSESYFGLDEVGTRIWQLLQEGKDLQEVVNTMLEEYEVSAEQLHADLDELLNKLDEAGLVSIEGSE